MTRRIVLFVSLLAWAGPAAAQEAFPTLSLRVAVAEIDGSRVVDEAWIAERVRWANRIFEPAGVSFDVREVVSLDARHARLENRADRHALGQRMTDDVINVFVVASLRDVDDPSRLRMGVHWRPRGFPGEHLVIVSQTAGETVLAHELGHFFGNRQHPDTPGNIMSYDRGGVPPFFDRAQIGVIRRFARRFLRTGELRPLQQAPSRASGSM